MTKLRQVVSIWSVGALTLSLFFLLILGFAWCCYTGGEKLGELVLGLSGYLIGPLVTLGGLLAWLIAALKGENEVMWPLIRLLTAGAIFLWWWVFSGAL